MEDVPRPVSQVSTADAEEFFSTGTPAYPITDSQPCCAMLDVPGVGMLHAHDCPVVRPPFTRRAGPSLVGSMPATLHKQLREELLCELIFAALQLANKCVEKVDIAGQSGAAYWCTQCHEAARSREQIEHDGLCCVGRVAAVLDGLKASHDTPSPDSTRKETAPDGGGGCADLGKNPRGAFGEPWQYRVDHVLQVTCVYDRQGTLIASIGKSDREAEEWAEHIVECVNMAAVKTVRS